MEVCVGIVAFIYLIYEVLREKINRKYIRKFLNKFFYIFSVLAFFGSICYSIYFDICYIKSDTKCTDLEHFKYLEIQDILHFSIKQVDEFILITEKYGKTVYILDRLAPICKIPLNEYSKNYDMFNLGNFGGKGNKRSNRRFKAKR